MRFEQSPASVRAKALDILARREHSAQELCAKLSNKGFDGEMVAQVVQHLADAGLQSDSRFAEHYSNSRAAKGFGPVRILLELQERGIDAELAEECVDKHDQLWLAMAREQLQKKYGRQFAGDMKELASMKRFLYYRGFDSYPVELSSDSEP